MKIRHLGVVVLLSMATSLVYADAASEREAEKLLGTIGMEESMKQSMSQIIDVQLQQNPALVPFREVMLKFLNKHMSWESLKPELLVIYTEAFTAEELREINAFYATETGKKTIEMMPVLMGKGAQIGMNRVQDNMQELQSLIEEESARLEAEEKK